MLLRTCGQLTVDVAAVSGPLSADLRPYLGKPRPSTGGSSCSLSSESVLSDAFNIVYPPMPDVEEVSYYPLKQLSLLFITVLSSTQVPIPQLEAFATIEARIVANNAKLMERSGQYAKEIGMDIMKLYALNRAYMEEIIRLKADMRGYAESVTRLETQNRAYAEKYGEVCRWLEETKRIYAEDVAGVEEQSRIHATNFARIHTQRSNPTAEAKCAGSLTITLKRSKSDPEVDTEEPPMRAAKRARASDACKDTSKYKHNDKRDNGDTAKGRNIAPSETAEPENVQPEEQTAVQSAYEKEPRAFEDKKKLGDLASVPQAWDVSADRTVPWCNFQLQAVRSRIARHEEQLQGSEE